MLEALQVVVFALGLTAVCTAFWFVRFFYQSDRGISCAMRWLLSEQIMTGVGTLIFSVNSLAHTYMGYGVERWNSIDPLVAIGLRTAMFSVMIVSTVRLTIEVRKVLEGDDD